jgi:hypothetical protein
MDLNLPPPIPDAADDHRQDRDPAAEQQPEYPKLAAAARFGIAREEAAKKRQIAAGKANLGQSVPIGTDWEETAETLETSTGKPARSRVMAAERHPGRAERRIGEMMAEQRETVGLAVGARGNPGGQGAPIVRDENGPAQPVTLADAGIDKHLADRARKLAAIPDEQFEARLAKSRERASAASSLTAIARLRHIASVAREHGGVDGEAFAVGVRDYEHGEPLDRALGLRPSPGQKSWRVSESKRACRDALRRAAIPGQSASAQADELLHQFDRYRRGGWKEDKLNKAMPPHYVGTVNEWLWRAFKATGGNMPGKSRLRHILSERDD